VSDNNIHNLTPSKYEEVEEAHLTPASFDPSNNETGKVKFSLTEPGIVRVFLRPKERRFIVLKTFLDFEAKEAGSYEVEWDGRDSKGNILDPGMYRISIQAQPSRDSVTDEESLPWDPDPHMREEKILLLRDQQRRVHAHFVHSQDKCSEIKVEITSPQNNETVKGNVKIVREIDEATRGYGNHHGHSARFYIDYMLLQENKDERDLVSEWTLNTDDIPPGKHVLTATACDHHDHMGSDSIIINVEK